MFRILVGELSHDRKGVERDREGSRKGSESEEKGRASARISRKDRSIWISETKQTPCPGRKMQGHSAETISARADPDGACHRHLDCVKERQQDLRKKGDPAASCRPPDLERWELLEIKRAGSHPVKDAAA